MKIETRIKSGKLKGWTIRKSKHGWYDLYLQNQNNYFTFVNNIKQLIT